MGAESAGGLGVDVAERLDTCVRLGAGAEGVAAYGQGLRRALGQAIVAATEPLEARAATKRQLGRMMRQPRGDAPPASQLCVDVDDSDDPQPHVTAFAHVLSAASVALSDAHAAAARLHQEPLHHDMV